MDAELFERVADFVSREAGVRRDRLTTETRLEDDLGVTGDDAVDLVAAFAAEFGVALDGFVLGRHFGGERAATPWSLARGLIVWAATGQRGAPSPEPVTLGQLATSAAAGRWISSRDAAT